MLEEILTDLGRGTVTLIFLLLVAALATAFERYLERPKR